MRKPELSGRMSKWSVHLSRYNIRHDPRTAIKSHALADFVSDFSPAIQNLADREILTLKGDKDAEVWQMHIDGASNQRGAARDSKMIAYLKVAKELKEKFRDCKLKQVPRDQNAEADALATLGATFKPTELANISIAHVLEPSIQKAKEVDKGELEDQQDVGNGARVLSSTNDQSTDPDWRTPYIDWLRHGKLPDDKKEVRGFIMKASRFMLIDNVLFRKSLAGPYLRCLDKQEAQTILHALHSGECGNHAGGRSLSNKALRQGNFWPTMRADSAEYARKFDACQHS
ncbi:uncharacterized protein LOC141629279 [Silene latifolia]|uniref:uncharacterized protein LOC141629279 n=1 Tax=Silene latifolia TaxID=37657 RepID=UPI003D78575D